MKLLIGKLETEVQGNCTYSDLELIRSELGSDFFFDIQKYSTRIWREFNYGDKSTILNLEVFCNIDEKYATYLLLKYPQFKKCL